MLINVFFSSRTPSISSSIPLRQEDHLAYYICQRYEKYKIKPESYLRTYLNNCPGFQQDIQEEYTINYLLVVLIVYWKDIGLLGESGLRNTKEIQQLFKKDQPYIEFYGIERLVGKHLESEEPITPSDCSSNPSIWLSDWNKKPFEYSIAHYTLTKQCSHFWW